MHRLLLAGTLLGLSSCSTYSAHEARTALLGMSQNDLLSCMGVPSARQKLDQDEAILDYDYTSDDSVFSLTALTLGSFQLGARGECLAIFRLKDGRVAGVSYSRATTSLYGSLGACGPLVAPCLRYPQRTAPPAGYDPMALVNDGSGR